MYCARRPEAEQRDGPGGRREPQSEALGLWHRARDDRQSADQRRHGRLHGPRDQRRPHLQADVRGRHLLARQ
eukprot:16244089-Heterocapsa_arctica.AAC.1